jgi:flagellar motor switch protein FliN/FliY
MAAHPEAQTAEFGTLQADSAPDAKSDINMDVILDVPVTLSMEVGRTRVPIRNLLQLNQGSVFVNGTLIAHGEVVVVNEKFGIRLTDVISPAERIRKLR